MGWGNGVIGQERPSIDLPRSGQSFALQVCCRRLATGRSRICEPDAFDSEFNVMEGSSRINYGTGLQQQIRDALGDWVELYEPKDLEETELNTEEATLLEEYLGASEELREFESEGWDKPEYASLDECQREMCKRVWETQRSVLEWKVTNRRLCFCMRFRKLQRDAEAREVHRQLADFIAANQEDEKYSKPDQLSETGKIPHRAANLVAINQGNENNSEPDQLCGGSVMASGFVNIGGTRIKKSNIKTFGISSAKVEGNGIYTSLKQWEKGAGFF